MLLQVLDRAGPARCPCAVAGRVTGTPQRSGQHPRRREPLLQADEHLRGRAEQPVHGEGPAARVAARPAAAAASAGRPAHRPDHDVPGQHHLVDLAGADPRTASAPGRSTPRRYGRRRRTPTGPGERGGSRRCGSPAGFPTVVSHQTPSRTPTTASGTISVERPVAPSNANDPKATGPHPGSPTSSTTRRRGSARHHASARPNGSGPVRSSRAAVPQPTRPSPPVTQARPPCSGSRSSSAPGAPMGTVRTVPRVTPWSMATLHPRSAGRPSPAGVTGRTPGPGRVPVDACAGAGRAAGCARCPRRLPRSTARLRGDVRRTTGSHGGGNVKVGVVGVGAVGAATALSLIERGGMCRERVVLVDRVRERANGVATDMRYATPLSPTVDVRGGRLRRVDRRRPGDHHGRGEPEGQRSDRRLPIRRDGGGCWTPTPRCTPTSCPRSWRVAPQAVLDGRHRPAGPAGRPRPAGWPATTGCSPPAPSSTACASGSPGRPAAGAAPRRAGDGGRRTRHLGGAAVVVRVG